jgi:hypothetical protein
VTLELIKMVQYTHSSCQSIREEEETMREANWGRHYVLMTVPNLTATGTVVTLCDSA